MHRWTVFDRNGREIYMTEERWQHILSKHHELIGHLDDVLETVKKGKRANSASLKALGGGGKWR